MRPLRAILLGAYMDRHGRKKGLILTLGLMAIGTLTIAATPSYAQIGLLAPVIIVAGRLLQGLSAGAEFGGVAIYLSEISTPGRHGFYCSWQAVSQQVAVVCASLFGVALAAVAISMLSMASPIFFQLVIDKVLVHQSASTLWVLAFGGACDSAAIAVIAASPLPNTSMLPAS